MNKGVEIIVELFIVFVVCYMVGSISYDSGVTDGRSQCPAIAEKALDELEKEGFLLINTNEFVITKKKQSSKNLIDSIDAGSMEDGYKEFE